jgi:hypothetical protein
VECAPPAVVPAAGQTRLFSLGADRRLIEYDLTTCTAANTGLRARSIRDCVPPGSTGSPTAMCFAPPMPYYSPSSTETLLLVAGENDQTGLLLSYYAWESQWTGCSSCSSTLERLATACVPDVPPAAADDAYKIKAYNPDAASALATATYLGPTFGEPINHLLPFRSVSLLRALHKGTGPPQTSTPVCAAVCHSMPFRLLLTRACCCVS